MRKLKPWVIPMLISLSLTAGGIIYWLLQSDREPSLSLLLSLLALILVGTVASNGLKLGFFKDDRE